MSKAEPHSSNEEVNIVTCVGSHCMAWVWDDSDELDEKLTHKYAEQHEIDSNMYSNPFFKRSTTDGWCRLIDKDSI